MDRDRKILFCLIVIIIILIGALGIQMRKAERLEAAEANVEVNITPVTRGAYTLFQYTNVGWTNVEYLTEYYIKDQLLYYRTKDGKKNFCDTNSFAMVEGWIEEQEKIDYGFYTWDYE